MGLLVKICGINSAEAADAAARAGADLGALVLHPKSPRNLRHDQAAALADRLRGRLRLVAMLSDPSDEAVAAAVAAVRPDFIQLHGRETPERVSQIRTRFGTGVIKAIPVADAADVAAASAFEECADMLLFDAKAPAGAEREGGHGAAFDWQILRERRFSRPWLLAGGLDPENVARAIRTSGAPGVDVSSGVETAPGQKSADLISRFVANARSAQFAKEAQP
ncbi:MAG TPA: phosphoribosylanthranilate isomerase [Rhizomicrobium sp.]|nr:phosphoribosylanthranilate isomerase [Rhizomicrobium sp.]